MQQEQEQQHPILLEAQRQQQEYRTSTSSVSDVEVELETTEGLVQVHDRLQYVANIMRTKQITPSSQHGLTILLTGANSGIGRVAAKLLVMNNPLHRIILACRTQESAERTKKELLSLLPNPNDNFYTDNIIPLQCDHTSFTNIHAFNKQLRIKLDETYNSNKWIYNGIDVFCCNAAVLVSADTIEPEFTEDELEVTFQTNYLAPFLLIQLLMDKINPNARIVLTTSALFDFVNIQNFDGIYSTESTSSLSATTATTTTKRLIRKRFEMIDNTPFHFKRAYSMSKLCLIALCSELVQRIPKHRNIRINCFSPGLMTTSGLFRHQNLKHQKYDFNPYSSNNNFSNGTKIRTTTTTILQQHDANVLKKEKTVEWGAGALVYMCIGQETGIRNAEFWSDPHSTAGMHSQYGIDFSPIDISNRVPEPIRNELWDLSLVLVGLPKDSISSS